MKITLFILITIVSLFGCSSDDCGECDTGAIPFYFEIVDKASGENLFTNGTYNSKEITVVDTLNVTNNISFKTTNIQFQFIDSDDANILAIAGIGLETEIVNMRVSVSGEPIFDFYVDVERKQGSCCKFNTYNVVEVRESDSEYDSELHRYTVFVD